jgi:predicted CopG family antitoxin
MKYLSLLNVLVLFLTFSAAAFDDFTERTEPGLGLEIAANRIVEATDMLGNDQLASVMNQALKDLRSKNALDSEKAVADLTIKLIERIRPKLQVLSEKLVPHLEEEEVYALVTGENAEQMLKEIAALSKITIAAVHVKHPDSNSVTIEGWVEDMALLSHSGLQKLNWTFRNFRWHGDFALDWARRGTKDMLAKLELIEKTLESRFKL